MPFTRALSVLVLILAGALAMTAQTSHGHDGVLQSQPRSVAPPPCVCDDEENWDEIDLGEEQQVIDISQGCVEFECLVEIEVYLIQCPYDPDEYYLEYDILAYIECYP